jgi:hypothetical protein
VEESLADTSWWDRWLPRLYEVLGRANAGLPYLDSDGDPPTDGRGYADLMARLFPPVGAVTWRAPRYAEAVAESGSAGPPPAHRPAPRAQVWEPVLRHVALALCALEASGQPGANPYLRLETLARLTGSWLRVLGSLVGEGEAQRLPGPVR